MTWEDAPKDMTAYQQMLDAQLGAGTDRRIAEGRARSKAIRAYRAEHPDEVEERPVRAPAGAGAGGDGAAAAPAAAAATPAAAAVPVAAAATATAVAAAPTTVPRRDAPLPTGGIPTPKKGAPDKHR